MNIELPAIPSGMIVLMGFFAPYAIAFANHPGWPAKYKKLVAIVISIVVAAVAIVGYYLLTGDVPLDWPWLILLALLVVQASYALVTKKSATYIEQNYGSN